jgi:hypothetical protein
MAAGQDGDPVRPRDRATFELERFGRSSADRLEVCGRFVGLGEPPAGGIAIVLQGDDGPYCLPVVAEESAFDHKRWRAAFEWDEAASFDAATLFIGADLFVELPEPRARRRPFGPMVLDVERMHAGDDQFPVEEAEPADEEAEPAEPAERVRWRAERLAAQQEAHEVRAEAERIAEELKRARADLEAERRDRSADAERFREGLAQVQAAADDALATRDTLLDETRAELEAARAEAVELRGALQRVQDENAGLRAALDEARQESADLRGQLEQIRQESVDLRSELEQARAGEAEMRAAAGAAGAEATELRGRLVAARDALGELP